MPPSARGLRARSILLQGGELMDWHSTQHREELLIVLTGRVRLELEPSMRRGRGLPLLAGQCAYLPSRTMHRVVNPTRGHAHYLYVTAPSDENYTHVSWNA